MIGRADENHLHVLALEDCVVILGGESGAAGELPGLGQVLVPYVADGGNAGALDGLQVLHQHLGPSPGPDAADADRVIGRIAESGCRISGRKCLEKTATWVHIYTKTSCKYYLRGRSSNYALQSSLQLPRMVTDML